MTTPCKIVFLDKTGYVDVLGHGYQRDLKSKNKHNNQTTHKKKSLKKKPTTKHID